MTLSIITINYNNKNGLRMTAESIFQQSWQDYEWIVVDGGSIDGSAQYISSVSNETSWWCSEKDTGVYNAMNKGIAHAQGEYLLILDSDIIAPDTYLEEVRNELQNEPADAYFATPTYVTGSGSFD